MVEPAHDVPNGQPEVGEVLYDASGGSSLYAKTPRQGKLDPRGVGVGHKWLMQSYYHEQQRFLKALGYISTYDRPPEVDERIQMYADTLYHRMLEQERAIKEAKAAGKPIPEFPPFVTTLPAEPSTPSPQAPASSDAAAISPTQPEELPTLTPDQFSPRVQARLAQRLKGLSPAEREVEEKAIAMEIRAAQILGRQIEQLFDEQGKEKKERKRRGEVTFADKVSTLFGW